MKINELQAVILQKEQLLQKVDKKTGEAFSEVLTQSLKKMQETQSSGSASLFPLTATYETTMPLSISTADTESYRAKVLDRAESSLDLIDRYREGLANPNTSLKDLNSIVQTMDSESDELNSLAAGLSDGDELKSVAKQLATTMKVEVMKFNRGDYL